MLQIWVLLKNATHLGMVQQNWIRLNHYYKFQYSPIFNKIAMAAIKKILILNNKKDRH